MISGNQLPLLNRTLMSLNYTLCTPDSLVFVVISKYLHVMRVAHEVSVSMNYHCSNNRFPSHENVRTVKSEKEVIPTLDKHCVSSFCLSEFFGKSGVILKVTSVI